VPKLNSKQDGVAQASVTSQKSSIDAATICSTAHMNIYITAYGAAYGDVATVMALAKPLFGAAASFL
jgi:hypothetical protein